MSVRRPFAAAGAALLAGVLGVQVTTAEATTPTVTDTYYDAGGFFYEIAGCDQTSGNESSPNALAADGAWHTTANVTRSGTYQGTAWSRSVSTKARITRSSRGGARLEVRATASSKVDPSPRATCAFNDEVSGWANLELTLPVRSWLVLGSRVASQSGNGQAHGRAVVTSADGVVASVVAGGSRTRLVAAGSYEVTADGGVRTGLSNGSTRTKSHRATVNSSAAFVPIGTRRTHQGTGRSYLTPGHRDCARNHVRVTFSNAVRTRARSITFSVDGDRRTRLTGRGLDRASLTLGRIARKGKGAVRADIVLRSGARRTMTSTSWPCA